MSRPPIRAIVLATSAILCGCASVEPRPTVREVVYNGWKCIELSNGRVDVVVAPDLGGRIIQLRLDGFEYLWVNRDLAGVVANGTLNGKWANYGGDKLWPAPQGWSSPEEWPGPPDPIDKGGCTDSGRFTVEQVAAEAGWASVRLVGPADRYAGIRFVRDIRLEPESTTVFLKSTMENVSDRPVRWGIWEVTQHDGRVEGDAVAQAPVNPKSASPQGYRTMFGPETNPQFSVEKIGGIDQFVLRYAYVMGKAGIDSTAGWLAVRHERSGHLFVHTFTVKAGEPYPDGASVEFWASGPGSPVPSDSAEPRLIESEILSPFVALKPGQEYEFYSEIRLAAARGPVMDVHGAAAVLEPLAIGEAGTLSGRIAAFAGGTLWVSYQTDPETTIMSALGEVEAGRVIDLAGLACPPPPGAAAAYLELRQPWRKELERCSGTPPLAVMPLAGLSREGKRQ